MSDKVFFDTNILVYLYSEDEPEKQRQALNCVKKHSNRWVSTQVLSEVSNTLYRKFKLPYPEIAAVIADFKMGAVYVENIYDHMGLNRSHKFFKKPVETPK